MTDAKLEFDSADPRWTTYALGELDACAPGERAALERTLAADPRARAFVDELRRTARALEGALAAEPQPGLTDAQRAVLAQRIDAAAGAPAHGDPASLARPASARAARALPLRWAAAAGLLLTAGVVGALALRSQWMADSSPAANLAAGAATVESERAAGADRTALQALGYHGYSPAPSARRPGLRALGDSEGEAPADESGTDTYASQPEGAFHLASLDPLSTFSIDVDTASYTHMRRALTAGSAPPPESVRVEEFVNYFTYGDPAPAGSEPFSVTSEVASCPWEPRHRLVRIGLKGRAIDVADRPASNLVFLIDVSGSMNRANKLPLLVQSMKLLVEQLDGRDRVALVVYAGASGLVLPATSGLDQWAIAAALDRLDAGGSTNGGAGIELAYRVARENRVEGGLNRVILCTDGDFNVGTTDSDGLLDLIAAQRATGVFLTVLGFGGGNDANMELLADRGDGSYAAIDTLAEARKVLVEEIGGTLVPIAKDVKIQVQFNPDEVLAWRLIGYENRALADEEFEDDAVDAGEIGAGHSLTALYELVPHGAATDVARDFDIRDRTRQPEDTGDDAPPVRFAPGEPLELRLRYKRPDGDTSLLIEERVRDRGRAWQEASADLRWAAAVAAFAQRLRHSPHTLAFGLERVRALALESQGDDRGGYRAEFLRLVDRAIELGE